MTRPAQSGTGTGTGTAAQRRRLLYGAVAGAAALGGAGLGWWRLRAPAGDGGDAAGAALWRMAFPPPGGGAPVALRSFAGRPLLLNFWATWCPPCVQELPLLDAFYREHAASGWQVLGLALDQDAAVRRFLQRLPLQFPVLLAAAGGADLARSLGNLSGGLPFSVVLGAAAGRVLARRMGPLSAQDLRLWARLG